MRASVSHANMYALCLISLTMQIKVNVCKLILFTIIFFTITYHNVKNDCKEPYTNYMKIEFWVHNKLIFTYNVACNVVNKKCQTQYLIMDNF